MATFDELVTEVQTHLIDTPTAIQSLTGTFVNRAIRHLQRKHNYRAMQQSGTFVTVNGSRVLSPVLSNFKDFRYPKPQVRRFDGSSYDMHMATEREAVSTYGNDVTMDVGVPRLLSINAAQTELSVYPYPDDLSDYTADGEYRIAVWYYAYTSYLSGSQTNWFTEYADEAIVFRAVYDGFMTNQDITHAAVWKQRYEEARKDLENADKLTYSSQMDSIPYHTGALSPHTSE